MKTASEFIRFFEQIPDEKWAALAFERGDCKCALGHLGHTSDTVREVAKGVFELDLNSDGKALMSLLRVCDWGHVGLLNDGRAILAHLKGPAKQPTPKARILAALRDIQAKEGK